jgi:DNA-binding NarL/FixJ family response regulator
MTAPIRLLLVDDHFLVRMGLVAVLGLEKDLVVVGEAEDTESALERFRAVKPDVTLLDIRMPGAGGLETLRRIRAEQPAARVIMLTTSDLEEDVFQSLEAGAAGYLLKTAQRAEIAEAIRRVHAGGRAIPAKVEARLAEHRQHRALSPRELEVLDFLRRGLSNRDIGVALGVTEHTAKAHVKAILVKLEAADRTEAVAAGFQRGLLKIEDLSSER